MGAKAKAAQLIMTKGQQGRQNRRSSRLSSTAHRAQTRPRQDLSPASGPSSPERGVRKEYIRQQPTPEQFVYAISKGIQKFMWAHAIPSPSLEFICTLLLRTRFVHLAVGGTYVICTALRLLKRLSFSPIPEGGFSREQKELLLISGTNSTNSYHNQLSVSRTNL